MSAPSSQRIQGALFAGALAAALLASPPARSEEPACGDAAPTGAPATPADAIALALARAAEHERAGSRAGAARAYLDAAELAASGADAARGSLALGLAGALYLEESRLDDAQALTRRALFLAAQAEAPRLLYRWQWQIARIHARRGNAGGALEALRQAVATARSPGAASGADADPDASPGALLRELASALLARAERTEDPDEQEALLRETRDALESLKASELRDYFRDPCLADRREVPLETVPGALVLYPVILEDRLELLVARGARLWRHSVDVDRATLRRTVTELRRALQRRATFRFRPLAERVHGWLIGPLAGDLDEGVDTLVVVPDGILRTIPIGALRDPESGRYLIERVAVAVAPGLRLIEPRALAPARTELLAAGISEARDGFPALSRVRGELDAVRDAFPGTLLIDAGFSADALRHQLETRAFDIVHIASHGEFAASAQDSFVLAHDRRIGMNELASLVGGTRFRDRGLELLTLSACETAAGDERAALGLAGIAVRSGARSALATLWAVHDAAAAELVARFYAQLREAGTSRSRALQQAKLHVLRETPYAHPAFWSPFLLINSWL